MDETPETPEACVLSKRPNAVLVEDPTGLYRYLVKDGEKIVGQGWSASHAWVKAQSTLNLKDWVDAGMPAERPPMSGNVTDSSYCAIFRYLGSYLIASGETPDRHEGGPYQTKKEALLAARDFQLKKDRDPNFILDLTNVSDDEISNFLR